MNRTIYMTYYKNIPDKVKKRWLIYNNTYKIDFSFDKDCLYFLKKHTNDYIYNLFIKIDRGMYKADLWRLCKLYINSGIYADVDLVPYININQLDKNITFYSCISAMKDLGYSQFGSIFQAFIANFSEPHHPIFLVFIISFLINKPYLIEDSGPTYDMYKCIAYMLNTNDILPNIKYEINEVKIKIEIGSSHNNYKYINLHYFPNNINYYIRLHNNPYNDVFKFKIVNNYLIIVRLDKNTGWGHNHHVDICFPKKTSFLFFKEIKYKGEYIVTYNNRKILDSRDKEYAKNKGW